MEKIKLLLSAQEFKIYIRLFRPLRMKEIANEMNLSVQAVDTYARNLYGKLGVGGRVELLLKKIEELEELLEDSRLLEDPQKNNAKGESE